MTRHIHEVEKAYDDPKFTMVYHDDHEYVIAQCSTVTFAVWMALLKRTSRSDRSCFPSLQRIATEAGVSKRSVVNAIAELEACGMVTVEKRLSDNGDYTSNLYRLHRAGGARGSAGGALPGSAGGAPGVVQEVHTNHTQSELDPLPELDRAESKKRKTQLTDDWAPRDSTKDWLDREGFTAEQAIDQMHRFIDHHISQGNTAVDWDRAFQKWMRNAKDWGHLEQRNGSAKSTPSGDDNSAASWFQYADELRRNGQ